MTVVSGAHEGADYIACLRVYQYANGAWVLRYEPVLFMLDGQEASVSVDKPGERVEDSFKLEILYERDESQTQPMLRMDELGCYTDQPAYQSAFMGGCCSASCTAEPGTQSCCGTIVCCTCDACCQTP